MDMRKLVGRNLGRLGEQKASPRNALPRLPALPNSLLYPMTKPATSGPSGASAN